MFSTDSKIETRIYVKIRFSEKNMSALGKVVYFKNEMTVDFFHKWKWYFEYRAALLRVKYPHGFVDYIHGPYEYILPEDKYREKVKNRYLSDKRQVTKFKNQINHVRKNWNEIFSIEENPKWNKVIEKLNWYENQAKQSKKEFDKVFNSK